MACCPSAGQNGMSMARKKKMRIFKKVAITGICCLAGFLLLLTGCYVYVEYASRGRTFTAATHLPDNRVGLLLGTSPVSSYTRKANPYYYNRIEATIRLYRTGKIDRILISGDNRHRTYNEPEMMKRDLVKRGIPAEHIYLDYAGFRTLDSVVRAKKVFRLSKFTVISQEFHNKRAVCLALWQGVDAVGYNAKDVAKGKGMMVQTREVFARVKLVLDMMVNKQPHFLGEAIDIK